MYNRPKGPQLTGTCHYEITTIGTEEFYAKPTDKEECGRRFAFHLMPDQKKIKVGAKFTEKSYHEYVSDVESRWWWEYEFEATAPESTPTPET